MGDVYMGFGSGIPLRFSPSPYFGGIDDALAWKTPNHELKQYLLVPRPTRNNGLAENKNSNKTSTPSTEVCFK